MWESEKRGTEVSPASPRSGPQQNKQPLRLVPAPRPCLVPIAINKRLWYSQADRSAWGALQVVESMVGWLLYTEPAAQTSVALRAPESGAKLQGGRLLRAKCFDAMRGSATWQKSSCVKAQGFSGLPCAMNRVHIGIGNSRLVQPLARTRPPFEHEGAVAAVLPTGQASAATAPLPRCASSAPNPWA